MQIKPSYTGLVAGSDGSGAGACLACKKVSNQLGRCVVVAASLDEGQFFNFSLPVHTGQHTAAGEVFNIQGDKQGCVCVSAVAARIAHAVGDNCLVFRCSCNNMAAGAHAEAVCAGAIGQVNIERVVRCGQIFAGIAILSHIDVLLQVLNANTHGKGLGLHGDALFQQHLEAVSRRVTQSQNDLRAVNSAKTVLVAGQHAGDGALFNDESFQLGAEKHLTAQRNYLLSDVLNNVDENIGADMGLCVVGDVLGCAVFHKLAEHPLHASVLDAGVQLAVGESACTAFTELDVAVRIQLAGGKEVVNGSFAGQGILSALDDERFCASLGQNQSRKHTCRAKANNQRSVTCVDGRNLIVLGFILCHVGAFGLANQLVLRAGYVSCNGADIVNVILAAGIQRLFNEFIVFDKLGLHAQLFGCLDQKLRVTLLGVEFYISDKYHLPSLPARYPLAHAHCRLYPPQSPSTSKTSPQAKRPGMNQLSMVSGLKPVVFTPPAVTCALAKPSVPFRRRGNALQMRAAFKMSSALRLLRGAVAEKPQYLTIMRPSLL